MKKFTHITFALFAVFFATVAANAQAITQGTVNFSVSVADAVDLRAGGPATGNGITPGSSQAANAALNVLLTVGDASPNIDNSTLTAVVPIQMRSNKAYVLTAICNPCAAQSDADFDSSDIGMNIVFNTRSGARVNTSGTDSNANWAPVDNKSVLSLSGGQTIATGSRISLQGDNDSTDNTVTANLNFSVKRQYYTPTAGTPFTQTVTLGIAPQP